MTRTVHSKQQIAKSKGQNVLLFAICYLLSAICFGQGFLPPASSTQAATAEPQGPMLIGATVPSSLVGRDENGEKRSLLTYKAGIELLAVVFLSPDCAQNEKTWFQLRRFYQDYKDWNVAFVAVNVGGPDARLALAQQLKKAGVPISILDAASGTLVSSFNIQSTPELAIIDEGRILHYRGPISKDARAAIEALIGHTAPVPNPEPAASEGCPIS